MLAFMIAALAVQDPLAWHELGGSPSLPRTLAEDQAIKSLVALDPSGVPVVAVLEGPATAWELRVRRWTGTAWSGMDGTDASIAVPGTGGHVYLVSAPSMQLDAAGAPWLAWADNTPGNYDIFVRRWNGSAWVGVDGTEASVNVSNTTIASSQPSLALDPAGRPVVAWQESPTSANIWLRRWDGSAWVQVGTSATNGGVSNTWVLNPYLNPVCRVDTTGTPVVAWSTRAAGVGNSYEVQVRRWNGTVWTGMGGTDATVNVSNNLSQSNHLSMALDAAGRPVIAWQDDGAGTSDIFVRRWSGSAWVGMDGTDAPLNAGNTEGASEYPSLALDGAGNPVVAWSDATSGNQEIVVRRWSGTAWTEIDGSATGGGISLDEGSSAKPCIAVDASGVIGVTWEDNSSGTFDVRYRYAVPPLPPSEPDAVVVLELDGLTPIGAGHEVTQGNSFIVSARATDRNFEALRLQVEAREVGTTFNGTPTSTGLPVAAGTTGTVAVTGTPGKTYRWQLRAIDATDRTSTWVDGGAAISFPQAAPPVVTLLEQRSATLDVPLPAGAATFERSLRIRGSAAASRAGVKVALEVELRGVDEAFQDAATASSGLVASGTIVDLLLDLPVGASRWQVRATDAFGNTTGWTGFGGNGATDADVRTVAAGSGGLVSCAQSGTGWTGLSFAALLILTAGRRR